MELEKIYEPRKFEPRWAQWWVESGIYTAKYTPGKPVFSLVIPPPNVTGSLHMGHMLEHTEIDVTIRWHRMKGDTTLWLPGTDHAGIATQMVVSRQLAEQGINYRDLGRDAFEAKVWEWKAQSGGTIKNQMIQLGASCDWSRERFTLDPGLSQAVREVFVTLYQKGSIYRGEYMVNWCPGCRTAISDLEVVHEETSGHLWHLKYPVIGADGNASDETLTVATTRPETMLGDTAVAINAKDERYLHLHGKSILLPLVGRRIPIILDDIANPEFGTGAVKITPAHDLNDFEAGKRHNLPLIQVIDNEAKMNAASGEAYAGLDRYAARKRIVAHLEAAGALDRVEDYNLSLGKCQRCKTVVEPLVSKQWFVRTKPLAAKAISAVDSKQIDIVPEMWVKVWNEWMHNIRDWCISRQLWWGHRIPAWYCDSCGEIVVAKTDPTACKCGGQLRQETDVLDTWFSAALWPFSTLGWPEQTEDLKHFYPTSLLITGFDILFFWVARMSMLGIEFMGDVPFRKVYIHGLVRDADKQKMSKTKGNVIDPLVVTEQYGTDAVRMALLSGAAPGTDIVFSTDRIESARAFANKIWNAARFLFMNMERCAVEPWMASTDGLEVNGWVPAPHAELLSTAVRSTAAFQSHDREGAVPTAAIEDRWIFSRLNECAAEMNKAIDAYRYHDAAQSAWRFFWNDFCDWYIELKKLKFQENSGLNDDWRNLLAAFESALRLLHPVMPFLTEELWHRLGGKDTDSISLQAFPEYREDRHDPAAEQEIATLQEIVTATRNLRAELGLDPKMPVEGRIAGKPESLRIVAHHTLAIQRLAGVTLRDANVPKSGAVRSTADFDLAIDVPGTHLEAQKKRYEKEKDQLEKNIANSRRQLTDDIFLGKAPAKVVDSVRTKLAEYETQLAKVNEILTS